MNTHTPGPWSVRHFPSLRKSYVVNATPDQDGKFVGTVIANETTAPECAANMRLIAAAPDLLAACQATVSAYSSHQLYDKCPLDMLRRAIAKATGEDQP